MAGASFQSIVPIQYGAGIPGALYDDSPVRSASWFLNSSSAAYNIVGATAFTALTSDPGNADNSGTAQAGGTGQFVGILSNLKTGITAGTTSGALYPDAALPNNVAAELVSLGHIWVTLPGTASLGDQVAFDQVTGSLLTYPKTTTFTAALLTTGVLSVSAVTAGFLQPGMILSGVGVSGVAIVGYDSGLGNTGTYYTDYIGGVNITAIAMTALSLPPPAGSFTGVLLPTGTLSITAVGSGELGIGSVISGTGIPAYATITALGTGLGGTGTYTVSPAPATSTTSGTITSDASTHIPGGEVILFAPAGQGALGVISLTGA